MTRVGILFLFVVLIFMVCWITIAPEVEETARAYYDFTNCLIEKDARFYCSKDISTCYEQKKIFASAAVDLPYVECSDSRNYTSQLEICREHEIDAYPTWIFADGRRRIGVLSGEQLSMITGCRW